MEKFGIFNILSSLLGNSNALNGQKNDQNSYPSINFSRSEQSNGSENSVAEKRATFAPLQNSMLSTMRSHEEFVKRVRAQNKKR